MKTKRVERYPYKQSSCLPADFSYLFFDKGVVGEDVINGSSTVGTFTFVMANSRTSLGASCLKFR